MGKLCMGGFRSFSPTSDPVEQMARCQELCQALAEDMEKESIRVSSVGVSHSSVL